MEHYEITLKNEKLGLYDRISWIIIFLHILAFSYLAFFSEEKNTKTGSIAVLILLFFFFIGKYFLFKGKSKLKIGFHSFYIILLVGWIAVRLYWFTLVPIIFDLFVTIATRKLVVLFSKENIIYPSFPVKKIQWNELSNVILKDDLLTIDLRTNKIIQQFIDEKSAAVNEKEFNDFCREQLKVSNSI